MSECDCIVFVTVTSAWRKAALGRRALVLLAVGEFSVERESERGMLASTLSVFPWSGTPARVDADCI